MSGPVAADLLRVPVGVFRIFKDVRDVHELSFNNGTSHGCPTIDHQWPVFPELDGLLRKAVARGPDVIFTFAPE